MSIFDCLLEKYTAQPKAFSEGGEMKDFELLSDPKLQRKVLKSKEGYISKTRLETAKSEMEEFKQRMGMGDSVEEDFKAAQHVYENLKERIAFRQKQISITESKVKTAIKDFDSAIGRGVSATTAIKAFNYTDVADNIHYGAVLENTLSSEANMRGFLKKYQSMLEDVFEKADTTFTGMPRPDQERLIMKAYDDIVHDKPFSKDTPSWAIDAAKSIEQLDQVMAEDLRSFGIHVKTKKGYMFGLFSDRDKVIQSGRVPIEKSRSDWVEFVNSLDIDWDNTKRFAPGLAETVEQRKQFLGHVFDSIVSNGTIKIGDYLPIRKAGMSAVANHRTESRLLQFNSAPAFEHYQAKYGQGSLLGTLQHVVDKSSRQVGTAATFGPQPGAFAAGFVRHLGDIIPAESKRLGDLLRKRIEVQTTGQVAPEISSSWRNAGTTTRQSFIGSNVGSAFLSALVEPFTAPFIAASRGFNPLKAFASVITGRLKGLSGKQRKLMYYQSAKFGWLAENQANEFRRVVDPSQSSLASKFTKRTVNFTFRASMLDALGKIDRATHAKEVAIQLSEMITGKQDIGLANKNAFKMAGLKEEDIPFIRDHGLSEFEYAGHKMQIVDLHKLWGSGDPKLVDLGNRLSLVFDDYVGGMTPQENAQWSDALQKLRQSGKGGFLAATAVQPFTGYTSEFYLRLLKPALMAPGYKKLTWGGSLVASLLLAGTLQAQLYRKAAGKEFLPMGPQLLMQGMTMTGLGPFAYSLIGNLQYGNDSMIEDLIPLVSPIKRLVQGVQKNVKAAVKGNKTHMSADLIHGLKPFLPGQSIWYLKLALQREVFDQLEKFADPSGMSDRTNRSLSKERKQGSGYWWEPGKTSPEFMRK